MSDDLRREIEQAFAELDNSYAMLTQELAGCRELCQSVIAWVDKGKSLIDRLKSNERAILGTMARWDQVRAYLQERLDDETDHADWWKQ